MERQSGLPIVETLVPLVGDGNPAALRAIISQIRRDCPELEVTQTQLTHSTILPKLFHKVMTGSVRLSGHYTENGTAVRKGSTARIARTLMGLELRLRRIGQTGISRTEARSTKKTLVAVQEMALQSLPPEQLQQYSQVYLLIPDVYGKLPMIPAEEESEFWRKVTLVVWNQEAYDRYAEHYNVELVQPWMQHVAPDLVKNPIYTSKHPPVYIKPSGSGWPKQWRQTVLTALHQAGIQYAEYDKDGNVTGPQGSYDAVIDRPFYYDISYYPPKVLIGYPSELIQVLATQPEVARSAFFSFPPRGPHELANLHWAIQHGYCRGLILPSGYEHELARAHNLSNSAVSQETIPQVITFMPNALSMSTDNTPTYLELLQAGRNMVNDFQTVLHQAVEEPITDKPEVKQTADASENPKQTLPPFTAVLMQRLSATIAQS